MNSPHAALAPPPPAPASFAPAPAAAWHLRHVISRRSSATRRAASRSSRCSATPSPRGSRRALRAAVEHADFPPHPRGRTLLRHGAAAPAAYVDVLALLQKGNADPPDAADERR
ncbi:hypothetical protein AB1Y20_012358 [Prymnesium parvum]|uniref:Uncharacterized protein n=1 Tax=Prymnesium parvum TaxID=97485 RepID=A0AB34IPG6_PRYPA